MGSQIAQVGEYSAEGDTGPEVSAALGGEIEGGEPDVGAMDHFGPSGDDSPPLSGDWALCVAQDGLSEDLVVAAYSDETTRVAAKGEVRRYARNSTGEIVSEIHLKGTGEISLSNSAATVTVAASGEITLSNGPATVSIATDGAIKLSGSSVSLALGVSLGDYLVTLHAALTAWTPFPGDGGLALKTLLLGALLPKIPPSP